MILGEGPLRRELEADIRRAGLQDVAVLAGFVDNPYASMSRAAVFALSSSHEGLPTVLVEAMACGTPVVATDSPGGVREIAFLNSTGEAAFIPLRIGRTDAPVRECTPNP